MFHDSSDSRDGQHQSASVSVALWDGQVVDVTPLRKVGVWDEGRAFEGDDFVYIVLPIVLPVEVFEIF